ncbi:hypothetical protein LTR17_027696, partial [Elasticomyces elasticus]
MMHEADYPVDRQVQLLQFHRFRIIPLLGPRPTSDRPWFRSRVAPGAGDGTPIGYSWKWSVGSGKPTIRHYMEPLGTLTGTAADPLNEVAPKQFLRQLAVDFRKTDPSAFWTYAEHLRPAAPDAATREKYIASAVLLGLEMPAESDRVDVMAGLIVKVPEQVKRLLPSIVPAALKDVFDSDVCLDSLKVARDFIDADPHLTVNGTMAVDCVSKEKSRFKFYTMNTGTSFDHIASVMTLGGRKVVSQTVLNDLRELWYGLKALPTDHPTSSELPGFKLSEGVNGTALVGNASGLSFYFDLHPQLSMPDVKMQMDMSKHTTSDWAAAAVVVGFLRRHGQAHYAQAYLNVLQSMVPTDELKVTRGVLAYYSFSIKKDQVEIKSYFNPQAYRRYAKHELLRCYSTYAVDRRTLTESSCYLGTPFDRYRQRKMAMRIPFNEGFWNEYLAGQKAGLPALGDVDVVSNRVVRVNAGNPGTMQLQGTNTYIVGTGRKRILIDTGEGAPCWISRVVEFLLKRDVELEYVLLTHWHGDHTGGVPDLIAYDSGLSTIIYKNTPDYFQQNIAHGQVFKVEGATLRAVFTPGHAVDHMCFHFEEENALFTGDNVLGHGHSVVQDLGTYVKSLKIMDAERCSIGYPGHGARIENLGAKMRDYIQHKVARVDQVYTVLARSKTELER